MAPPSIRPAFFVYWEAFQDLQSERVVPRGTIPVSAIIHYADRYGIDPDMLKRIVWKTDRVLLDHWKEQDEAQKAKAENKRKGLGHD